MPKDHLTATDDSAPAVVNTQQTARRLTVFLLLVLLVVTVLGGLSGGPAASRDADEPGRPATDQPTGESVELTIEFGDAATERVAKSRRVAWRPGLTVLEALLASDAEAEVLGRGANAFLTAIDGVANGGSGNAGWQYWVNGELGDVGAGDRPVAAGDRVLWRHAPYE